VQRAKIAAACLPALVLAAVPIVVIAARDPHGFRPLTLGRLGDAYIVCSETCALDLIDATWVRDIEPGEVLIISKEGVESRKPFATAWRTTASLGTVFLTGITA
jgi:amidophosphoribosyltransferase